jgi:hypothetical protein
MGVVPVRRRNRGEGSVVHDADRADASERFRHNSVGVRIDVVAVRRGGGNDGAMVLDADRAFPALRERINAAGIGRTIVVAAAATVRPPELSMPMGLKAPKDLAEMP